ncbi:MAG TPA: DUF2934 domain-containing protein [Chthoniobacteraceae bacterium]|nr:DUF2934 domain-containing protein [Chthoniobacteraceae bacterium]
MGKKIETPKPVAETPAPAAAAKPAATKKPAAKKKAAKAPAAKKTAAPKAKFTHDDIALRAYFIAEKRHKAGLPGDSQHDWIEAERQLLAESKKKTAAKAA